MHIPFAAGLQTKSRSARARTAGAVVAKNIEFDEVGGLQKRKPYAAIGANIFGGGTIADARRLYSNGDELMLFTKEGFTVVGPGYCLDFLRGTYLAPKITERSVFVDPNEQI